MRGLRPPMAFTAIGTRADDRRTEPPPGVCSVLIGFASISVTHVRVSDWSNHLLYKTTASSRASMTHAPAPHYSLRFFP